MLPAAGILLASTAAHPAAADSTDIDRPIIVETVSGTSPLPAGCGAPPADGYTLNPNTEVLPSLARDPNLPQHLVTVYQAPVTLQRNDDPNFFNDRPTVAADPYHPGVVYAVWDRVDQETTNGTSTWKQPVYLAKSTDDEPAPGWCPAGPWQRRARPGR